MGRTTVSHNMIFTKNKKARKIHREDKAVMIQFIDYARLSKKVNVGLEISARYVAEYLKISPNQSNGRLANRFAFMLETGKVA